MSQHYDTPDDFLSYLQDEYAQRYPSGDDGDEFKRITDEELAKHNLSLAELGEFGGLQLAIRGLKEQLYPSLTSAQRTAVEAQIAVGLLPNGDCNAFIARSPDGKFAICVCSALMVLLHKYLKLVRAFVAPQDVVFCNRKEASALTKDDASQFIAELLQAHLQIGNAYGPLIKLSESANAQHSTLLTWAELFILCHELGHYLNGDLSDPSAFCALPWGIKGSKYEENRDHEKEHLADVTGFTLYIECLKTRGAPVISLEVVKPLMAMFNLIYALGGGASSTHPHPYDRMARIVEHGFGADLGAKMKAALADPDLLPDLLKTGSN